MDQIIHHLKNSNRILITTHTSPDGDAIGSLMALGLSLDAMDNTVILYNQSPIPAVYRFLPSVSRVVQHLDGGRRYDVAVVLDCGDLQRIGQAVSVVKDVPVLINIDHHVTNTYFGDYQYVDTSACATAELVYRLIRQMALPIDKAVATSIYTGILADTGSFRFSNTNKAAFTICEEMIGLGADPYYVAQHVYGTYSLGRIKLLNLALDSIELSPNGKLSLMAITRGMFDQTGTRSEDTDGMINYAKNIEDVRVAVLIQQVRNGKEIATSSEQFHVSLRSDGSVDVAEIAAAFGGGGHASAAGFSIDSELSDIKSRIYNLADKL
jgi:phosphoesterase RecJ-like protein